jgi:hypothetical protein
VVHGRPIRTLVDVDGWVQPGRSEVKFLWNRNRSCTREDSPEIDRPRLGLRSVQRVDAYRRRIPKRDSAAASENAIGFEFADELSAKSLQWTTGLDRILQVGRNNEPTGLCEGKNKRGEADQKKHLQKPEKKFNRIYRKAVARSVVPQ